MFKDESFQESTRGTITHNAAKGMNTDTSPYPQNGRAAQELGVPEDALPHGPRSALGLPKAI